MTTDTYYSDSESEHTGDPSESHSQSDEMGLRPVSLKDLDQRQIESERDDFTYQEMDDPMQSGSSTPSSNDPQTDTLNSDEDLDELGVDDFIIEEETDSEVDGEGGEDGEEDRRKSVNGGLRVCPQCNSEEDWGVTGWCPICGYYPRIKKETVEVEFEKQANIVDHWWELIAPWGWVLIVGILGIVAGGLFVRFQIAPDNTLKLLVSLGTLVAGATLLAVVHLLAYLAAVPYDAKLSPFDFFMNPVGVWKHSFSHPSESSTRIQLGVWAIVAILTACFIMDGIHFSAIFQDWDIEKTKKQTLVQKFVQQARGAESEDESMEEALEEFVGDQEDQEDQEELEETPPKTADCVVVGVRFDDQNEPVSLALASLRDGRIQYVGSIMINKIPTEEMTSLAKRFKDLKTSKSLVTVPSSNQDQYIWLKPKLLMKVGHFGFSEAGKMERPKFDSILEEL